MMQGQPIIILKEGTDRSKGKGAQSNNIAAARAVADAVRSTLGPKGMDKMLVDSMGDVTITNDGVTILKEIEVEHPAAKMIVEVAKTQDDEVGDGTTTAVILAGELLKKAETLVEQNVHPTIIVNGFKIAASKAIELLDDLAFPVKVSDTELLKEIASTAMNGRSVGGSRQFLAEIAVKAVKSIVEEIAGKLGADVGNILVGKESDMKKLAKATGGKIVVDLNDLGPKDLGHADLVEERKIGEDEMTFLTGCKNAKAVSILIRGGTEHVVDEVERIMHDALRVVGVAIEDGKALPGGGAADIELSLRLKDFGPSVGGREQLAIEAFSEALEIIPWTLAENGGLDAIDLLIQLRTKHEGKKGKNVGVDLVKGAPGDMIEAKEIEPRRE